MTLEYITCRKESESDSRDKVVMYGHFEHYKNCNRRHVFNRRRLQYGIREKVCSK